MRLMSFSLNYQFMKALMIAAHQVLAFFISLDHAPIWCTTYVRVLRGIIVSRP